MTFLTLPTTYPVSVHTDTVQPGGTFVALTGYSLNGIDYIQTALSKGARRIVVQKDACLSNELQQAIIAANAELIYVANARAALARESAHAYNYPANKLKIIAITGTKGKTTTCFLLEHIFANAGYKTALLTSVHNKILNTIFKAPLTTAQPDYLHNFFNVCVNNGVEIVIMEVAAQAVSLHRIETLQFDGIVFTNFGHEHGEFYPTQQEYLQAKYNLFNYLKSDAPVFLNADDNAVRAVVHTKALKNVHFFSQQLLSGVTSTFAGIRAIYRSDKAAFSIEVPSLVGAYNLYNCIAAITCAWVFNISKDCIEQALLQFPGVPGGRLNLRDVTIVPSGARVYIDHAHNPSSFEAIFKAIRPLTKNLIVVFGAGGDKDHDKRPIMGALAAQYCDKIFITTDNPRSEDGWDIAYAIYGGISEQLRSKAIIELDREKAIMLAVQSSCEQSVILLLGKGPEEYQHIKGQKYFFSERDILNKLSESKVGNFLENFEN